MRVTVRCPYQDLLPRECRRDKNKWQDRDAKCDQGGWNSKEGWRNEDWKKKADNKDRKLILSSRKDAKGHEEGGEDGEGEEGGEVHQISVLKTDTEELLETCPEWAVDVGEHGQPCVDDQTDGPKALGTRGTYMRSFRTQWRRQMQYAHAAETKKWEESTIKVEETEMECLEARASTKSDSTTQNST